MQLRNIVLYGENGKQRILTFELGKVNIITGESKTGKTAIIDIVDYCLGSSDFKVAEGKIREHVLWFGILLQLKEGQIFIARPNPSKELIAKSSPSCFIIQGDSIEIPNLDEIIPNSTIDSLKIRLENVIGIGEYTHNPEDFTRRPLSVTFKHSRIYCFQHQNDIDQQDLLFYHQNKDFGVAQAIKDTLPYFLGAVREDSVKLERDLADRRRNLNRLERELKEGENVISQTISQAFELLTEAKQVELISNNVVIENEDNAISFLKNISEEDLIEIEPVGEDENLIKFLNQKDVLKQELNSIVENIKAAEAFEREAQNYTNEAQHQASRLESIELYKNGNDLNHHICPLCNQELEVSIPSVEEINTSLKSLKDNLEFTRLERPKLNLYLSELQKQKQDLIVQIAAIVRQINGIYRESDQAKRNKDLNLRKGKVLGRISLYLESYKKSSDFSELKRKIESIKADIEEIERQLSKDETEDKMEAILNQLNVQMSDWSNELDLEFKKAFIRFSVKKLTLFIDTAEKTIRFDHVGSGENWVAYHLLIHFALHKYFVVHNRPVPNFLIIDQMSQAYFPPEKDVRETGDIEQSSDEIAIKRLFDFVFNRTEELEGNFQVILTDHAKLNDERFQKAIVEEWRKGVKLVPINWYE